MDSQLDRHDVFELRLKLDWLIHRGMALPEGMLGLELSLGGLARCVAKRLSDTTSEVTAVLETHPPLSVHMEFRVLLDDGVTGHKLHSYTII
jgi:hypothetical protein